MSELSIWKIFLYSLICTGADGLDIVSAAFSSIVRNDSSHDSAPSCIDGMSDEDILAMKRIPVAPGLLCCNTFWLGDSLVGKITDQVALDCPEANAIDIVRLRTNIPVPRIRRVIPMEKNTFFLVMDRVKGKQLSEVWNTLSLRKKISVTLQLRRYITQLRRFTRSPSDTPPGPVSAFGAQDCSNPRVFGYRFPVKGPFETNTELIAYCNERYHHALKHTSHLQKTGHPSKQWFDDSESLILCHQDLTPRNMILGEDGKLWLIDWGNAGYYPPWFEHPGMLSAAWHERHILENVYNHWDLIIPFVCGKYFKQTRRLMEIRWTFDRPRCK